MVAIVERYDPIEVHAVSSLGEIGMLWNRYVPDGLTEEQELDRLYELLDGRELKFWEVYRLYMRSQYWLRIRDEVLDRDGRQCVLCGSVYNLHVDHRWYNKRPEIFGQERMRNLRTLCRSCHASKTKQHDLGASSDSKSYEIDVEKDVFENMMRRRDDG